MKNDKPKNLLDDLPFDKVKALYCERLLVESANDIKGRTQLLRKHPELFDEGTWEELGDVFNKVIKLQEQKCNDKNKPKDDA